MANLKTKTQLYLEANSKTWDAEKNNIVLRNDGDGDYIHTWSVDDLVKPTNEQLDALETEATALDNEGSLGELRAERNKKLTETDWVITMHKELGTNIPAAWKTYRQALRDITDDATSLDDVTWPEKP